MSEHAAAGTLWVFANVLVSILALAVSYYDGIGAAIMTWIALTIVLIFFRPQ